MDNLKEEMPSDMDNLTAQEYGYLYNFMISSEEVHTSAMDVYNTLRDVFYSYPHEADLKNFQFLLSQVIENSNKVRFWSMGNLEMNRFPASKTELKDARNLTLKITHATERLCRKYETLYASKSYFAELGTLGSTIAKAASSNNNIYGLVVRIEDAMVDEGTVDKSLLAKV